MGKLDDWFGAIDDKAIYRANDPEQKVHWRRLAVAGLVGMVVASILLAGAGALFGSLAGAVGVTALCVYLVVYVVWRRRRNKRLTGSPTEWPSA